MTVHASPFVASTDIAIPSRLDAFCAANTFDQPTLVIDVDRVETQCRALAAGLGRAAIHDAVKANLADAIIARLVALGSHFDAASKAEIALCLDHGADPAHVSFGNTIKRRLILRGRTPRASHCSRLMPKNSSKRLHKTHPQHRFTFA